MAKPIPAAPFTCMPLSVTQRFIPGLCFEGTWTYQTCTLTGEMDWSCLPLDPETPEDYAGQGIWWCVRRCAAVLLRQPWAMVRVQPHLPAHPRTVPDVDDAARILECLLPGWPVVCQSGAIQNPVTACAPALRDGGSALLLLQSQEIDKRSLHLFWAWVVGLETRRRRAIGSATGAQAWAVARDFAQADGPEETRALLAMPFGWSMPWSCGYAARVQMNQEGLCDVGGIAGRWHRVRCLAAIALSPPAMPGRSAGDAVAH